MWGAFAAVYIIQTCPREKDDVERKTHHVNLHNHRWVKRPRDLDSSLKVCFSPQDVV